MKLSRFLRWPTGKRMTLWLLIIIALSVVIPALLSFSILRFPRQLRLPTQGEARAVRADRGYQPLEVVAADGVTLRGYSVHQPSARGSVVLVHGWGANLETLDSDAEFFLAEGFDVAGIDLRGHGESGGDHSMLGFAEIDDFRRMLARLRSEGRLPEPIIMDGISLGAGFAILIAAEEPDVAGVIADSPFNRLTDAVDHYAKCCFPLMPKYPLRWTTLRMVEWQIGRRLSALSVEAALPKLAPRPILLVHCENDPLVLCRFSEEIAAAYSEHGTFWRVPGGDHLTARWDHPEEWERRVREFLDRVAPRRDAP